MFITGGRIYETLSFRLRLIFRLPYGSGFLSSYTGPQINGDVGVFLKKFDHLLSFLIRPKWKNYDFVLRGDVNSDFDVNKSKRA